MGYIVVFLLGAVSGALLKHFMLPAPRLATWKDCGKGDSIR